MQKKKLAAPIIVSLCIFATILMLTPRGFATPQTAQAGPLTISMTPGNGTSVQGLFNVTITLSGSTTSNIGGVNLYISFDDRIVNATRWFCPTDDPNFFLPTSPAPSAVPTPPDPGYHWFSLGQASIQVGVSKGGLPPAAPWGTAGVVCIIEFNATGAGGQTILLYMSQPSPYTFVIDETATPIDGVVINDGSYPIVPEFPVQYALLALIGLTLIALEIRKKAFPKAQIKNL